ncbi:MAG: carbamoyl-phosphate synthase large subunit [Candidatus Micrarchaeota archaeon]
MKKPKKVLVIGSGPIVIGQSAEFDYSGTQACKVLREEGIIVVLVNSNPATIQTDPETADRIYIEPLTIEVLEKIIAKEKPEGILATVGGQTALNLSLELHGAGILAKYGVEFLGTGAQSIQRAEGRESFNEAMDKIGVPILPGRTIKNYDEALEFADRIGYPLIIRPSFTLGGTGGGIAYNKSDLKRILELAFRLSANHEALVEKSVLGWGEFEYEVVRDARGNSIIICNMENFDPMGIHTGESIVVAPSQTLNDKDHQMLRNAALRIVDEIGIKGSCNVQFSFNQKTGEFAVIEINPRLSRSSALASKATGYPIARVATKIALGYDLYEIKNAITGTNAAFEPSLDYIVTKIPRWPFDKFEMSDRTIGTQMKSTGETMSIGRTFEESLLKALRSLDIKPPKIEDPYKHLNPATDIRLFAIFELLRKGESVEKLNQITNISKWFLYKLENIAKMESELKQNGASGDLLRKAKRLGFSDKQIAKLVSKDEEGVRTLRHKHGIIPTYKIVDSCAGEFEAVTPYYYSTYEQENEVIPSKKRKAIVIGSGPIRIGQGIEFDYCCSHAAFALKEMDIESIVINNNPETISTDFDSSDRLYFEPLTAEDVLNICELEKPDGVIVQFGGQTSLNLVDSLTEHGFKVIGTSPKGLDVAEDRDKFSQLMKKLKIPQPDHGIAFKEEQALVLAKRITYPIVVRPSYVIAGRAMAIVYDDEELKKYMREAVDISEKKPILIDKYLDNAIECEVDAIFDGSQLFIGGIMEHIEPAGVHSGDANIVVPSIRLTDSDKKTITKYTQDMAEALGIVGMINVQYVVKDGIIYCLEANPRASRTVPFLSKAIGIPMAKIATKVMAGHHLSEFSLESANKQKGYAVKSIVFPFLKIVGADITLGPEMKSTGETMGIGHSFEIAYYKALLAAGIRIKERGDCIVSLNDLDKVNAQKLKSLLQDLGYMIYATPGTAKSLKLATSIPKIGDQKPDIIDIISECKIDLIINTPRRGGRSATDGFKIRRASIEKGIPCITNLETAIQLLNALKQLRNKELNIEEFREYK